MSRLAPDDNFYSSGPSRRYYNNRDDDGGSQMYDDYPRSRSQSADRRRGSPGAMRSSPHDMGRFSPQGPVTDRRGDYARDSDFGSQHRGRDWDDHWRRSSRSPPPRRGRPSYTDRDREGYRSPQYDSGSRSRSSRRNRAPHYGHESREVMMDGLPTDMVEDDISHELKEHYNVDGLEDLRVIRDRVTKASRGLGFLTFQSVGDARDFLEPNFPYIYFSGRNPDRSSRGAKVRIAYSREREDRHRTKADTDWTCQNCAILNYSTRQKCFRCQAPRPEAPIAAVPIAPPPKVVNNGDNDAASENEPSQFLLIRGLEASVTEELLAKGVAKLYRPPTNSESTASLPKKGAKVASTTGDSNLGARDGSIRRVLLVRDRKSNESWRYGFAEFSTLQDAQAAMARLNSFDKFTVSSKPVLVSYIHAGVFVPVMNPTPSIERFTFSPLTNPALKLMYWDEEAYVTELTVSPGQTEAAQPQSKQDRAAAVQSESHSKASKEAEKIKKRKADAASNSGSKKLAVPSHLQFWSNRHAELHGIQKKDAEEQAVAGLSAPSTGAGVPEAAGSPADPAAPPAQSFADPNRNCCYLCMRQFNSSAEVNRHERLSQLHQRNLQNDEAKAKALAKLAKHGITQPPPSTEYRDRARERRKAFGSAKSHKSKAATLQDGGEDDDDNDDDGDHGSGHAQPAQTVSKGASLLSKMGWSAGSGLGAQGTGVTAPITTEMYAQGVGLGAQGGKLGEAVEEAGRNTRSRYDEFLEKTKQTARERYEQMG